MDTAEPPPLTLQQRIKQLNLASHRSATLAPAPAVSPAPKLPPRRAATLDPLSATVPAPTAVPLAAAPSLPPRPTISTPAPPAPSNPPPLPRRAPTLPSPLQAPPSSTASDTTAPVPPATRLLLPSSRLTTHDPLSSSSSSSSAGPSRAPSFATRRGPAVPPKPARAPSSAGGGAFPPSSLSAPNGRAEQVAARRPLDPRARRRYDRVFEALLAAAPGEGEGGKVQGVAVREVWRRSRLGDDVLRRVWDEVAAPGEAVLDADQFSRGMWAIDEELRDKNSMSTSLISSLTWIPRGVAAPHPTKYTVDEAELERVQGLARGQLDAAKMELELAKLIEQGGEGGDEEEGQDGEWEDEDASAASQSGADGEGEDVAMDADMDDDDAATAAAAAAAKKIKAAAKGGKVEGQEGEEDEMAKYNLDTYDEEESHSTALGAFSNIKGLTYYADNAEDPYVTLEAKQEDAELEREELEIYPTDNLLVAAKTEDDVSQLEIYVYDEAQENLYVHHDLLLPAMPLCLEWLDFCPGKTSDDEAKGNFIAVGTLDPEIEIWSLDVVDGLFPDALLGPPPKDPNAPEPAPSSITDSTPATDGAGKKKKKKKPKKPKVVANPDYHVDSILSLSWNRAHRNFLASSSADKTIKVWDLSRESSAPAARSYDSLHGDKIQSVQWNQKEPTVILSGAWDGTVRVTDIRAPAGGVGTKVDSDVECLRWDPWQPTNFLVSMENGTVQAFDSRMLAAASDPSSVKRAQALWTLAAHDASVSSLDINPLVQGCIVTGGTDNLVKVWNVDEQGPKRNISLVTARDLGVGKVFSASFCPDDPTTLAVAGSKANLQIWDTATNPGVRSTFGDRLKALGKDMSKTGAGIVGVADDEEDDEFSDED
ncbi:hypothetical protein JCM10207_007372 [Rhodosporidiobolus poonsookiae]